MMAVPRVHARGIRDFSNVPAAARRRSADRDRDTVAVRGRRHAAMRRARRDWCGTSDTCNARYVRYAMVRVRRSAKDLYVDVT